MNDLNSTSKVIVYVDKTMVSISGIKVDGLNTKRIETLMQDMLQSNARIIGVTSDNIELDIYGANEFEIGDIAGKLLKVISLTDEISCSDIVEISSNGKLVEVDYHNIPTKDLREGCVGERWIKFK